MGRCEDGVERGGEGEEAAVVLTSPMVAVAVAVAVAVRVRVRVRARATARATVRWWLRLGLMRSRQGWLEAVT